MWCRALLFALAVTYLVCVLMLSGVKQEDLDVNTLIKLQRHNVNLGDMKLNNETLRKECASTMQSTISSTTITEPTMLTTEIENQAFQDFGQSHQLLKSLTDNFKLADLNSLMNYIAFKNAPNYGTQLTPAKNLKPLTYSAENELSTTTSTTSQSVSNDNIVNIESKGNLQQILSFWDKFKRIRNVEQTTESYQVPSYTKEKSIINNNHDFISLNIRTETTIPPYYLMPVDIAKDFEDCLINQQNNNNTNLISSSISKPETLLSTKSSNLIRTIIRNMQVDGDLMADQTNTIAFPKNMSIKKVMPLAEIISLDETQNTNKILEQYKELKRSRANIIKLTEELKKQITNLPKTRPSKFYSKPVDIPPREKQKSTEIEHVMSKKSKNYVYTEPPMLQQDIIKEIAENVKALVINDIRNEILPTTIKTTVSTDTTTITESNQVIQKIIDMLELMKNANRSTNTNTPKTNSNVESLASEPNPVKKYVTPFYLPFAYPRQASSAKLVNKPFNYKFTNANKKKPINRAFPSIQAPIIQTNSDEIPPLAIPISKLSKIIRQTIIVTTVPTTENTKKKYVQSILHNHRGRNNLGYTRISTRIQDRDNPTRFNLNHSFKQNHEYISRGKHATENIKIHRSRYQNDINDRKKLQNNIPRFHEQLERGDIYRYNSWENKRQDKKNRQNYKVASRQQMPINSLKASSYDDTHFRNFIKTQQKVNSMLERILATKVIADNARESRDEPRSIELP